MPPAPLHLTYQGTKTHFVTQSSYVGGRLYDPSGQNELAPLDDFGRQNLGAPNIEFRAEGDWQAA